MAKQTFTTGQVLTAAQLTSLQQTAMSGGAASAKTASYTLVAADAGTAISMTSTSATTITVNTGLFAAGDTVFIQNLGTGNLTITAGTATVNTAGSLILPQYDAGLLYFVSASSAVFYDYIQVGATSPLTTKGDLYTFGTSDTRLAVGANGTTLVADSAEATGLKWATASSGGMTLISETVASSLSSLTFSSLGSYKQLFMVWAGLRHSASNSSFSIRFNNNSSTIYTINGFQSKNQSYDINAGNYDNLQGFLTQDIYSFGAGINLSANGTDCFGSLLVDNYTSGSKSKYWELRTNYYNNFQGAYYGLNSTGFFNDTTAITSLDIVRLSGSATFSNQNNTTIRLYGVS